MTRPRTCTIERMVADKRGGFSTLNLAGPVGAADMDPFIFTTFYDMSSPTFPPHPHAGFVVATYMLPESPVAFMNQDSLGTRNRIRQGGLHVTVAGRGVIHEEQPDATGVARGFQMWIDLPDAERDVTPAALSLEADDVPVLEGDGFSARVLLGRSGVVASPIAIPTPVTVLDVTLAAGHRFVPAVGRDENAFMVVQGGALRVAGGVARASDAVRTRRDGDVVEAEAVEGEARFTLFAGRSLGQERVMGGPMVGTSDADIARYRRAYEQGRMGTVVPFARQS